MWPFLATLNSILHLRSVPLPTLNLPLWENVKTQAAPAVAPDVKPRVAARSKQTSTPLTAALQPRNEHCTKPAALHTPGVSVQNQHPPVGNVAGSRPTPAE